MEKLLGLIGYINPPIAPAPLHMLATEIYKKKKKD